ncbi:FtsX-like permease family protein [candidate division KSB1 bacterium]|nr:FtsX-like permease family protein [candidate division KSB1 bacterium]
MKYELYIARRYLQSKRKTGFISLISYISIGGVIVGVAALIIVLSVMNGFEQEVRSRFLSADSHIRVQTFHDNGIEHIGALQNQVKNLPHVMASTPYIQEKALIKSKAGQSGVVVRGIAIESAQDIIALDRNMVFGSLNLGITREQDGKDLPGIVIGFELAKNLQVIVGDEIVLLSLAGIEKYGDLPFSKRFRITGYFETGLVEFDGRIAYVSVASAQELFKLQNRLTGLWIQLDDYEKSEKVAQQLETKLGYPYKVYTWRDLNPNLFAWMQIEKWGAFIVLSLIIMVAAFNIVSTLIMLTIEKQSEIGILKSMGATQTGIKRVFMYQGLLIGITGTLVGVLLGTGFCLAQAQWHFFSIPGDVYIINYLPIATQPLDVLLIAIASTVITTLSAIYPARKAARLDPISTIRFK